jgi:hypothetical protein
VVVVIEGGPYVCTLGFEKARKTKRDNARTTKQKSGLL